MRRCDRNFPVRHFQRFLLAVCLAGGASVGYAQADPSACLARLRPGAPANGVAIADFDRYTSGAQLLETTVAAAKAQPEGQETWWDYYAKTVDAERIAEGRQIAMQDKDALAAISANYDVDAEVLVAIFGIETNYGTQIGKTRVLDAWLTRACTEGNALWKKNVYASIRLLNDGIVADDSFIGSWSGAFGMTQFIPTSFYELAADGDGDGKIDLYGSKPDALASTANHLRKRGTQWLHGLPALIEVKLPAQVAATVPPDVNSEYLSDDRRSLAQWVAQGVTRADGSPLVSAAPGGAIDGVGGRLFAPTGVNGPVFLATNNFDAILHYNRSKKYGLVVGMLINRLKGDPDLVAAWPTDDPGLSRIEIRNLQALLQAHGHDIGAADGIPGAKTREAVAAEQARLGLPQDGRVGRRILSALNQDAPTSASGSQ